jgi:tetratricopeptide (TPR) repeat protein
VVDPGSLMDVNLTTAWEAHQAGRYADAARAYHALLLRDPDDPAALHLFGVLHHQCGYPARAAELIGRAVALRPDVAAYHANLAEAQRALGRHEEAAASCRAALALRPDYPEALNNLGLALHELGRHQEAVTQLDAALALRPDFAMAQNNRGSALRALGKTAEAVEAYRAALTREPTLALAHANLGQVLVDQGQPAEGLAHCREAVRLQPDLPAAHNNLGNTYRALQRWAEARDAYGEALRLAPKLARAHVNLGFTYQLEGRHEEAIACFRHAVELSPDDADVWQGLADAHAAEEDSAAALSCRERVVALRPTQAGAHSELGWALQDVGRLTEAAACYARALELQPDHAGALLHQGGLHEELGQLDQAEACFRRARTLYPQAAEPLARLATLLRGRLPDADLQALGARLDDPALPDGARGTLLFGLAQVQDARGAYAEAAACLARANPLILAQRRQQGRVYDPAEHSALVDRILAGFTPELFGRLAGAGDDTRLPVFVFGMPRSGTTLVEQVLASHPLVHGAGELPLARQTFLAVPDVLGLADEMRSCLEALDARAVRELCRRHRDGLRAVLERDGPAGQEGGRPEPQRVVDKMPDNYLYLGLLAVLFPRATFLHVRRDLRDVAVSCWMTHFRSIRWASDPDHLAGRCRDYRRLMEHWQAVLPVPVHEVAYERLVDDFEAEARRLVAACGLEWEPDCLRFHQTRRPVRTASVTQVRQPLYRRSLARWRHYEATLADLFALLPKT